MDRRKILTSAFIPGMLGLMGTSFYVLGDTLIVGQALGRAGLASLNLSIPMINVMQGLGLLFGFGGATAMSRAIGREDTKRAKEWAEKTLSWSVVSGIVLLALLQLFFTPLLTFLTGGGPALQGAREYLGILLWFSPIYMIFQSLVVLLRNDGGARRAMTALLLCSALNIALDALFLFGFHWGMFGAGLATGIAQVAGLTVALLPRKNAKLLRQLRPRFFPPLRLMGKGLASFVMELSQGVVIFVFNAVLLRLVGELGVSSYAIIANLSLMFTSIFLGLTQGAQPLLSVAKGKGDQDAFHTVLQFSKQVCLILSIATVFLCLVFPQLLARVFISGDQDVLDLTIGGLRLYGLGFLFLGFNLIGTVALQSAAESGKAFAFAMLRGMLLLIVCLFVLQYVFGTTGVWLAFPLTELLSYLWIRGKIGKRRLQPNTE